MNTRMKSSPCDANARFGKKLATAWVPLLLTILLCSQVQAQSEEAAKEENQKVLAAIKEAIPAATAMKEADWKGMAESAPVKLPPPTLMGLCIRTAITGEETEELSEEFGYVDDAVDPAKLAREVSAGDHRTWIKAKHITEMTCDADGDSAKGDVTYVVPKLVRGKFQYTAENRDGEWVLTSFSLPIRKLKIELNEEGEWRQEKSEQEKKGDEK